MQRRLTSDVAVAVVVVVVVAVVTGGCSSNWTPAWDPPHATGVALKSKKKKGHEASSPSIGSCLIKEKEVIKYGF